MWNLERMKKQNQAIHKAWFDCSCGLEGIARKYNVTKATAEGALKTFTKIGAIRFLYKKNGINYYLNTGNSPMVKTNIAQSLALVNTIILEKEPDGSFFQRFAIGHEEGHIAYNEYRPYSGRPSYQQMLDEEIFADNFAFDSLEISAEELSIVYEFFMKIGRASTIYHYPRMKNIENRLQLLLE